MSFSLSISLYNGHFADVWFVIRIGVSQDHSIYWRPFNWDIQQNLKKMLPIKKWCFSISVIWSLLFSFSFYCQPIKGDKTFTNQHVRWQIRLTSTLNLGATLAELGSINNISWPKHGGSDGSAFASRSKGRGFESRWILWDHVSKWEPYWCSHTW